MLLSKDIERAFELLFIFGALGLIAYAVVLFSITKIKQRFKK